MKTLRQGRYVDILEKDNGNLLIVLNEDGRKEAEDYDVSENDYSALRYTTFYDIFEDHLGNGWMDLEPEQIGALTDCDIIIAKLEDIEQDDDGTLTKVNAVYWHERYQIENPIDMLLDKGLTLIKAKINDAQIPFR